MKSNKNDMLGCIAEFCTRCAGDHEPEKCNDINCPAYKYRLGDGSGARETSIGKSIRNRCLECFGQDARGVLMCESYECALWVWRLGDGRAKRPKTAEDKLFEIEEDIEAEDILFG